MVENADRPLTAADGFTCRVGWAFIKLCDDRARIPRVRRLPQRASGSGLAGGQLVLHEAELLGEG